MIGRPNLPRDHCDRFRVLFHVELSKGIGEQALRGSFAYTESEGGAVALYGKSYKVGGSSVAVEVSIFRHDEDDYHVNVLLIQENRGSPPKEIKSPDHLMNLILSKASSQTCAVHAYATYRYDSTEGWNSDPIVLPMQLKPPWRLARGMPFTQIDGVSFSHVVDDNTPEKVDISLTNEGEIIHEIFLRRERVISKRMIHGLMGEGRRLSSSLVDREEENLNA